MQKSLSSQSGNLFIFSSQWCGPHKASGSSLNLHWALFEAKSARPSQTNPDPGRLNILKLKLKQTLIELIKLGWESANLFRILLTWIHNITFCQHLKKLNYSFFFRHRGWGGQAQRRTKNCQKEAGWLIRRHGGLEVRVPTVPVYHCFKRKVLVRVDYLAAATKPSLRVTWGKCWIWSWDNWVNSLVLMTT